MPHGNLGTGLTQSQPHLAIRSAMPPWLVHQHLAPITTICPQPRYPPAQPPKPRSIGTRARSDVLRDRLGWRLGSLLSAEE